MTRGFYNCSLPTHSWYGRLIALHLRSFKTPPSGAVMSDEDDADCAFSMRKGVRAIM